MEKIFKDIVNNMEYGSQLVYNTGDGKPDKKKEVKDRKEKKRKKNEVTLCKHRVYGYTIGDDDKKKAHLIKVSNHCKFNVKSKDEIAPAR